MLHSPSGIVVVRFCLSCAVLLLATSRLAAQGVSPIDGKPLQEERNLIVVKTISPPAVRVVPEDDRVERAERIAANIRAARQNLELAEIRLRSWTRIDEPLRQKQLDHEIALAEAQLAALRLRLREYEPHERWRYSKPMFLTLEETRLSILALEQQVDQLRTLRAGQLQHPSEQRRILELQVEQARQALRDAASGK